ncbi:MAG TPA: hypothetical protein VE131_01220 [Terriglobales bacterium]|nr:hypothetical protein [Terriglobales bacterium]
MSFALVAIAVFLAGSAAGYLVAILLENSRISKRHRTEKVIVRGRVLAAIKEQHEREVLQQIFQIVDAIHTDTENALGRLVNRIQDLLLSYQERSGDGGKRNSKIAGRGFYLLKNPQKQESLHSGREKPTLRTNAGQE